MAGATIDREEAVYFHTGVVRGHHIYQAVWISTEDGNDHDRFAVCVKRREEIVGHVPREILRKICHFLRHGGWSTCEITGRRKRGNRLEAPCVYRFVGKRKLIEKLGALLPSKTSLAQSCPFWVYFYFSTGFCKSHTFSKGFTCLLTELRLGVVGGAWVRGAGHIA